MNRNRFQLLIIFALLISNILLIVFVNLPKKGGRFHPDKPRNIIIERLQLDNKQIEAYDELIKNHRSQIREKDQKIIQFKNQLYSTLQKDVNQIEIDSLTSEIAAIQQEIESIHFQHFKDIKKLCRNEQLDLFNKLVSDLSNIFSPHPPKRK